MGKEGGLGFCPFSLFLFAATAGVTLVSLQKTKASKKSEKSNKDNLPPCTVIFVVGAPGTGKGTQCQLLIERTKGSWVHLSAGDLLRDERKRAQAAKEGKSDGGDLELANTIESCINAGKLVPSSITVRLLEKGMTQAFQATGCTRFLLDGFPRGQDNIDAWDQQMGGKHTVTRVLNFDAPEEVLVGRLLQRGKSSGRSDDNLETIRKRFQTHVEACKPVLERFSKDGILESIGCDRPVEEVYQQVEQIVMAKS